MNRILMLGALIVCFNLAACATRIDDPTSNIPGNGADAIDPPHIDASQIFPTEETQGPVLDQAAPSTMTEVAAVSDAAQGAVLLKRQPSRSAAFQTLEPGAHVTWDDLLGCLSCAAEKYKAHAR